MYIQNQRFTDDLKIDTEISVESGRIVVRIGRNVLAYAILKDSGDEIQDIYTKLYTVRNNIEQIVREVFPILQDCKTIRRDIIIPIAIEVAPEFYSHDVVLIDMFDDFVQKSKNIPQLIC